eukprot:1098510-Pleurochrysis_carterae.AAC.1
MSKSNLVIQLSMKAVNAPRFDLQKYNEWASRTISFLKIHAPDLANWFSIIPSLDLKQRREFDEFTKPPNAPIQAVNYLRSIANAHMRHSCYPLYPAHPFVQSASSHTLVPVQAAVIDEPVREGGVGSVDVKTDRSRSQAERLGGSGCGELSASCGDGPLSKPGGRGCGWLSAPGGDGPLSKLGGRGCGSISAPDDEGPLNKQPWERRGPRVQRSASWRQEPLSELWIEGPLSEP